MIRTAITASIAVLAGIPGISAGAQEAPAGQGQAKTFQDLVADMKAREQAAGSVYMEMVSRGSYPGGIEFETEGTLRVLQGTHFHATLEARFGDQITARSETVKTPAGAWFLESDPAFGEVYLKMDQELAGKLDEASRILGGQGGGLPGPMAEQSTSPLGGSMLEAMARQYDLKIERELVKDGQDCWVVAGDLRGGLPEPDENAPPVPDRVDVLVRKADRAVVQMVHLKDGREQMRVNITRLEVNRPMEEASFRIAAPGAPKDVMEHPPYAVQIQSILDMAEAKKKDGGQ